MFKLSSTTLIALLTATATSVVSQSIPHYTAPTLAATASSYSAGTATVTGFDISTDGASSTPTIGVIPAVSASPSVISDPTIATMVGPSATAPGPVVSGASSQTPVPSAVSSAKTSGTSAVISKSSSAAASATSASSALSLSVNSVGAVGALFAAIALF
ncbi:hypothetical protein QFC22_001427 [Naganishia vaughanmartiniae]|uniref:Uncharacterized protein n=1 Tax=Naganishia vaughanmartiniae TaxID=1424756 RepID=A0ACC2XH15_9TREE|nr:hypothetical protein QFC22_001427 [Naganishia vaughanmartiniae]